VLNVQVRIKSCDNSLLTTDNQGLFSNHWNQGLGAGVGRIIGDGLTLGVGVGRGVGVTVGVGVCVGVAVAVAVGVGVGLAVGVGVGVPSAMGAWITTVIGEPVLKKSTVASAFCGG